MTAAPPPEDEFISTKEAAELIGVATRTLWQWNYEERGPRPQKYLGRLRYNRAQVTAWIAAQMASK